MLIYATIIETTLDEEEVAMNDEDGELLGVVYDCAGSFFYAKPLGEQ